jgi:hypothetical protein
MAATLSELLADLERAGADDCKAVLDGIESVKRTLCAASGAKWHGSDDVLLETDKKRFMGLLRQLYRWSVAHAGNAGAATMRLYLAAFEGVPHAERPAAATSGVVPPALMRLRVPPSPDQLDDALNDLKACVQAKSGLGEPVIPWYGPDWEALERVPRRLLRYMNGRETAKIDDTLYGYVWGDELQNVGDNAFHTAKAKANTFLAKRRWGRRLAKVREEPVLRWEPPT